MAFTMHSHSGQFCPGHAKDQLEEIVKRALSLNMQLIALTEHMPRTSDEDLYPEEVCTHLLFISTPLTRTRSKQVAPPAPS